MKSVLFLILFCGPLYICSAQNFKIYTGYTGGLVYDEDGPDRDLFGTFIMPKYPLLNTLGVQWSRPKNKSMGIEFRHLVMPLDFNPESARTKMNDRMSLVSFIYEKGYFIKSLEFKALALFSVGKIKSDWHCDLWICEPVETFSYSSFGAGLGLGLDHRLGTRFSLGIGARSQIILYNLSSNYGGGELLLESQIRISYILNYPGNEYE